MDLQSFINTLHWTHIGFGFVAFFVAPVALASAKGGRTHRRWGRVYFWSMVVVAATALFLAMYRPNYFLAVVSVFSFYLAFRGYRALKRKPSRLDRGPTMVDYTAMALAFLASILLVVLGVLKPAPVWVQLGPVAIVFGGVGLFFTLMDLYIFTNPPQDRFEWWYAHMAGMIASYLAALSAFSVNNFHFLPVVVRWIWPTAVGVPVIVLWIRHYKKRFNRPERPDSGLAQPNSPPVE
jgi:uncharacterized membrane protein